MIEGIINRYDLIYRLMGLSQAVGLGLTTLLSLPTLAATTNYVAHSLDVSKDAFGVVALVCGLLVTIRRWSFWTFFVLMWPLIIYTFANARYVYVAGLSPTVPSLLMFAGVVLMLMARYGFKALQ